MCKEYGGVRLLFMVHINTAPREVGSGAVNKNRTIVAPETCTPPVLALFGRAQGATISEFHYITKLKAEQQSVLKLQWYKQTLIAYIYA